MTIRIAVDCMGGDHGVPVTLAGCFAFAKAHPDAELILVGKADSITAELSRMGRSLDQRMRLVSASETVEMDDPLDVAVRRKKDSSMRVAIIEVRDGRADACVSAGNTAALMAISRYLLKTLDGIDRPAIAVRIPNQKGGGTTVLDLGANVDCEPLHLVQFAIMGSALVAALDGEDRPTVGILNIGEEIIKGNDTVKQAGELLRESGLNFIGNVEGNDVFKGTAQVVVCDGFVGNVLLKASEGTAQLIGAYMKEEFYRSALSRLAGLAARPVLLRFRSRLDHRRHNGATLLGLRGVVMKSHGSADAYAFRWALERAYEVARHDLLGKTSAVMASMPGWHVAGGTRTVTTAIDPS